MEDESCLRGRGFESRRCILDGHDIFHIDVLKKMYCLFKKSENKQKRPELAHFKKTLNLLFCVDAVTLLGLHFPEINKIKVNKRLNNGIMFHLTTLYLVGVTLGNCIII